MIRAVVSGTQGTNGWYTSNVGVTWNVTDPESSITSRSGCGNVTLTRRDLYLHGHQRRRLLQSVHDH